MLTLIPETVTELLLLGAHCDDIAIGCGGTLLTLCTGHPGIRITALVLTGANSVRADEEQVALRAFCPGAQLDIKVLDFPDGRLPAHWTEIKDALETVRTTVNPDLIFAPHHLDAHQDHSLLAALVPQVFRKHASLRYEIVKWESDLRQPTIFHPLTDEIAVKKSLLLTEYYPSQAAKSWFDRETFLGLARVRGVQSHSRYAEAFHADKVTIGFSSGISSER